MAFLKPYNLNLLLKLGDSGEVVSFEDFKICILFFNFSLEIQEFSNESKQASFSN